MHVHTSNIAQYIMVHYHGNHFLNPIFLGSESGSHGNVLYGNVLYIITDKALLTVPLYLLRIGYAMLCNHSSKEIGSNNNNTNTN